MGKTNKQKKKNKEQWEVAMGSQKNRKVCMQSRNTANKVLFSLKTYGTSEGVNHQLYVAIRGSHFDGNV